MHHHDPNADTEIIKPEDAAPAGDEPAAPAGDESAGDESAGDEPAGDDLDIRFLTINDVDDLYRFCWIHHDLVRNRGTRTAWDDLVDDEREDVQDKVGIIGACDGKLPHGTQGWPDLSAYDQDEQDRWRDIQHAVKLVIRARAEDPGARPNR
jgi:hypothetical protein